MSMIQTAQFLAECPRLKYDPGQSTPSVYYFMYDNNYLFTSFRGYFPNAQPVGPAWLPGWTWHLNCTGTPNIRRAFYNRDRSFAAQAIPAPATEISIGSPPNGWTFGMVFKITVEDDAILQKTLGISRIRMVQSVNVIRSRAPMWGQKLPVMTYFDARNTSDVCQDIWKSDKVEASKWRQGIYELLISGAPKAYIQSIYQQLNGNFTNVEPLYCYDLKILHAVAPSPPPVQRAQRPKHPQLMRTLAGVRDVSGQRVQSVRTSGGFTNAAGYPEGQPRNTVNLAQKRKPTDKDKPAANAKRPRMMPTPYPPPRSDTAYPV